MSYTPSVNADTLTLYLGICATGAAVAGSHTLSSVVFGTIYNPSSVTFTPDDVGMPIAIVGGGTVDSDMPPVYFVQGALFHTTIATYVDSQKTGGDVDISGLKIEKIPTFIFFKDDKEIGRIVESPEVNIETDLLKILKQ